MLFNKFLSPATRNQRLPQRPKYSLRGSLVTGAGVSPPPSSSPHPPPPSHAVVGLNRRRVTGAPLHRHVRGHAERHPEADGDLEGSSAGHPRHGPLLQREYLTSSLLFGQESCRSSEFTVLLSGDETCLIFKYFKMHCEDKQGSFRVRKFGRYQIQILSFRLFPLVLLSSTFIHHVSRGFSCPSVTLTSRRWFIYDKQTETVCLFMSDRRSLT